jgi:membrane-associated phospholipid phosphatase
MLAGAAVCVLAGLTVVVRRRGEVPGDLAVMAWCYHHRVARLFQDGINASDVVAPTVSIVVTSLCVVVAALLRRRWWPVLYAVVMITSVYATVALLKVAIARPDPEGGIPAVAHGGSFPSGHVTTALVCGAVLLAVTGAERRVLGWVAVLGWGAFVAAVMVYIGAHRLSDVEAAAATATALCALGQGIALPWLRKPARDTRLM